ncbi:MAG: hypothetical protein ACI8T1_000317 [Verrucomicrobiales bacterium]|jgi:hypothetical protein
MNHPELHFYEMLTSNKEKAIRAFAEEMMKVVINDSRIPNRAKMRDQK